ncbi:MAG: Metallophosphoesterase [candidate division CPR3 bacterium GW2011_GWF2_35_18]|uniref:Metallophosphoesterase n=1 Tax=candidate division CPR3 bacterium GW2011_GWF2_35_18 TaxID=1618350 RepID=A0A0G0C2L7_UNCC3|nr:MAG: Metallophosphoesterase [candidate division CPR3 bacterium GW2011_GWF2_35_18]
MVLIFWLSSIPNLKIDDTEAEFFRRKFVHLFEYGLLWFLIYRAIVLEKWRQNFKERFPTIILSFVLTVLYAVTDELHQMYVPTRTGKFSDMGFDILGGLLGIGILNLINIRTNFTKGKKKEDLRYKKPLWPMILGIGILLLLIIFALIYYDCYCPSFDLSSFF